MDYCDILFTNNEENRHRDADIIAPERKNNINVTLRNRNIAEDTVRQQRALSLDEDSFFLNLKNPPLSQDCKKKFLVAYYYQYKMGHGMGRVFVDEYENTMFSVAGIKAVEKKISDNLGESAICVVQNIIELKGDSCDGNE